MRLSVIIPSYNAADTLADQLSALAQQSWSEPWEVIVVDNNSTDSSVAIAEQFQGSLPNLRIVHASKRRGAAYSRNVGAQAATADLLAFCDADDVVGAGWVEAIAHTLQEYEFVASRFECTKLNSGWALEARGCPQTDGLQQYRYPPFLPHAGGCGLGVRRSIHQAVGGFDETMLRLQDTDYCWRIQLAGVKLHFVPAAVVHIRHRQTLTSTFHQARRWGQDNVLLYKKFRPLGMPELTWRRGAREWLTLLQRTPWLLDPERRLRWLWRFNWRVGRVQGCLKHRVLAL